MGTVISITNQKGGVGKTTTTINLASALGQLNRKVLVIDLDPQGSMTLGLGQKEKAQGKDIYNLLTKQEKLSNCIIKSVAKNLDLIPATVDLAAFDIEQARDNKLALNPLKEVIDGVRDKYDFVLIDCPPSLGLLNRNSLAASNSVIIPIQAEFFALEGLTQLFGTIRMVHNEMGNRDLEICGILITMYDSRLNISRQVLDYVRECFGEKAFNTIIPRNVSISEAPSKGISVLDYRKKSAGAIAYIKLAEELVNPNFGKL